MNKQWIVVASVVAVVVAFIAGAVVFKGRETQQVSQAAQSNSDALVRASSPVFGNPAAKTFKLAIIDDRACRQEMAFKRTERWLQLHGTWPHQPTTATQFPAVELLGEGAGDLLADRDHRC